MTVDHCLLAELRPVPLQNDPDKEYNMPKDGTVHELTSNVKAACPHPLAVSMEMANSAKLTVYPTGHPLPPAAAGLPRDGRSHVGLTR